MKERVQKFGRFLSGMVMPNIGAFIAWGFIAALFIADGWFPNEAIATMVTPMLNYLLPLLIGYTGGKMVGGQRGAVAGAIATLGVIVGADITMFIGAMIAGPLGGLLIKWFDKAMENHIPAGFEMLVNNFSVGILGGALSIVCMFLIGPACTFLTNVLGAGVEALVDHGLLPLTAILVEPAKVLFLNNAINHGVFTPIGTEQAMEAGKSILFMIESNPGPGLGLLLAYCVAGKGNARSSAAGAALMAGVQVEHAFLKACSNIILNDAMQQDLYEKMLRIGAPEITAQDEAFAAEMARKALSEFPEADARRPIHWEIRPYAAGQETPCFSSTDVGDVSWICPTAQVAAATAAYGTPGHSWQMTAQGKTPLAHKMTRFAAKAMAATAAELIANAALLQKAREEHRRRVGKSGYVPPIPQGVRPRALEDIAAHETASV